jgi:small subunit ribosomal protein S4
MINPKCKICRREGEKLFLRGERCLSPKCAMIKRPYAPGMESKKKRKSSSEYGKELREKQKLKRWYNLRERQFAAYVEKAFQKRGKSEDTGAILIKELESRLDNVVYRMGLGASRIQARQIVSHGHFLVNGKKIDVPSYHVRKGDVIGVKPGSLKSTFFKNSSTTMKKQAVPSWLQVDAEKLQVKIIGNATMADANVPAEVSMIFEYYSR